MGRKESKQTKNMTLLLLSAGRKVQAKLIDICVHLEWRTYVPECTFSRVIT